MWGHTHVQDPCHRCGRELPLRDGHCRRCLLFLAETAYDLDRIVLDGGDQLWSGGPYSPHLKTTTNRAGEQTGLYGSRLQTKPRLAVQASRATAPDLYTLTGGRARCPGRTMCLALRRCRARLHTRAGASTGSMCRGPNDK
ncbi:hypothetical protein [Streptomyces gardneri]|uniref:hypothetical protein n=1 Tax=Streptomyces gardneri TaxID=66892 RepID=UPI0033FEE7DD